MNIPFDVKIFSWLCESGKYLLPFLFVLWLAWLIRVTVLRKRKQFLCTSAAFFLFCLLGVFFTWSGWHYRMELRKRYAVVRQGAPGWREGKKAYNINLMPHHIRAEYEKNGSRPRLRDVRGQAVLTILLIPVTLPGQLILYLIFFRRSGVSMPRREW